MKSIVLKGKHNFHSPNIIRVMRCCGWVVWRKSIEAGGLGKFYQERGRWVCQLPQVIPRYILVSDRARSCHLMVTARHGGSARRRAGQLDSLRLFLLYFPCESSSRKPWNFPSHQGWTRDPQYYISNWQNEIFTVWCSK